MKDNGLSFNALRRANLKRQNAYRRGTPWTPAQWVCAVTGELGETANIVKKIFRGDFTLEEKRGDLADELADIQTYLDLLAESLGIDLGAATIAKWNAVSERVGSDLRL